MVADDMRNLHSIQSAQNVRPGAAGDNDARILGDQLAKQVAGLAAHSGITWTGNNGRKGSIEIECTKSAFICQLFEDWATSPGKKILHHSTSGLTGERSANRPDTRS